MGISIPNKKIMYEYLEKPKIWVIHKDGLSMDYINCILSSDEKSGSLIPSTLSMFEFMEVMSKCELFEPKHLGQIFSWCNNRVGGSRIVSHIDKALINQRYTASSEFGLIMYFQDLALIIDRLLEYL